MKKIFIILMVAILLISCTAPTPNEKPQPNDLAEPNNTAEEKQEQRLETKESYIYDMAEIRNCRVTADTADVKSGAGNSFSTIGTLKRNDVVDVLGQLGDWYVVRLDDNQVGAIDSTKAQPVVRETGNQRAGQTEGNQPQQPQQTQENQENFQAPQDQDNNQAQNTGVGGLTSQERQMIDLVNQERAKNNLPALEADLEVTKVARIKSQDMVDNNYFSHNSPTYGSPFDMMTNFGVEYLHAGENLAGNSTVENAHDALMNSSGHRQNILSPDFTHVGIGIRPSDRYGYVFTQMFISKPQ